jgi:hypothetical protein
MPRLCGETGTRRKVPIIPGLPDDPKLGPVRGAHEAWTGVTRRGRRLFRLYRVLSFYGRMDSVPPIRALADTLVPPMAP